MVGVDGVVGGIGVRRVGGEVSVEGLGDCGIDEGGRKGRGKG